MPRPIWTGSISFGLVNVPVRLVTATSAKDVRFHQLHGPDGARIQQKRVCAVDGEEVPYEEIVKGYELSPGQYVVIEPEELATLDPESSHSIDLEEFVDLDQIDPIYFDKAYYLIPDKRAEKPYALLVEAMSRTNKVGLARFVMRTKQYLAALRAKDNALVLSTMLFDDEVVPLSGLEGVPDGVDLSEREVAMAEQLVSSLATDFEPAKYHDDYRQRVLDLIQAKAEGQVIAAPPVQFGEGGKAIDFCVIDDLPTLVWTANLAAIELHPTLSRAGDINRPTSVVFDLDPGPPAGVVDCARVAMWLREVLDQLGLESVIKTSGSKGLQLYVPLNTEVDYRGGTQPFSRAVAQLLERQHPDAVVSQQRKDLRPGKVLIDWSQNTASKSTVSVYSLRARPAPTVSTPVAWDEVEVVASNRDAGALVFETDD